MGCISCYKLSLEECPEDIVIEAGLTPDTDYKWEIEDKFGTIYNGTATSAGDGKLTINVNNANNLPKGLFMHFSGAFTLQLFKTSETTATDLVINTQTYKCIELVFKAYIPATV